MRDDGDGGGDSSFVNLSAVGRIFFMFFVHSKMNSVNSFFFLEKKKSRRKGEKLE